MDIKKAMPRYLLESMKKFEEDYDIMGSFMEDQLEKKQKIAKLEKVKKKKRVKPREDGGNTNGHQNDNQQQS
jgi:hypothetical protein